MWMLLRAWSWTPAINPRGHLVGRSRPLRKEMHEGHQNCFSPNGQLLANVERPLRLSAHGLGPALGAPFRSQNTPRAFCSADSRGEHGTELSAVSSQENAHTKPKCSWEDVLFGLSLVSLLPRALTCSSYRDNVLPGSLGKARGCGGGDEEPVLRIPPRT